MGLLALPEGAKYCPRFLSIGKCVAVRQGPLEIASRLVRLAGLRIGQSEVGETLAVVRVFGQRFLERRDGERR